MNESENGSNLFALRYCLLGFCFPLVLGLTASESGRLGSC